MYEEKDINREFRYISNYGYDLVQSNSDNFLNRADIFIRKIQDTPALNQLLAPYFERKLNLSEIIIQNPIRLETQIKFPATLDDRIAFILQFLRKIVDDNKNLHNFMYSIYGNRTINNNYIEFNRNVTRPLIRDLLEKIQYFIEDNITDPTKEISPAQLQIINATINTQGNVAVGHDIVQNISHQYIPEDVLKKFYSSFMENGLDPESLLEIKTELQSLSEELAPGKQDQSKVKQIISTLTSKLGSFGKDLIEKSLVTAVASTSIAPIITSIMAAL